MNPLNEYYFRLKEPTRSILLFLREFILNSNEDVTEDFSFGLPFFKYKGKMLCYFNFHKKYQTSYISFNKGRDLDFPELLKEDRKLFKILLIDESADLPIDLISEILEEVKSKIK